MAHEHNDECKSLRSIVDSLVAQQDIPLMDRMAIGGESVVLLGDTVPHLVSGASDDGNIALELESARRALEVMGCAA